MKGLEEWRRTLDRLPPAVATRIGKNMVRAGARVVASEAKRRVPVRTGALRKSIKTADQSRQERLAGIVKAFVVVRQFYGRFLEFGTAHQAVKPFLRPARDESAHKVHEKMAEIFAKGIDREIKKGTISEESVDEVIS